MHFINIFQKNWNSMILFENCSIISKLIFGQYFQNKTRCAAATLVKQADSSVYRGCFGMILRASQQSARAYTQIGIFCATRWGCPRCGMLDMLKSPAKKMGAGLLWRHRQTCLLFRDRSDVEHGCIFRPIVFYTIVRAHENLLYGPV